MFCIATFAAEAILKAAFWYVDNGHVADASADSSVEGFLIHKYSCGDMSFSVLCTIRVAYKLEQPKVGTLIN